jgi:hypothetical protein
MLTFHVGGLIPYNIHSLVSNAVAFFPSSAFLAFGGEQARKIVRTSVAWVSVSGLRMLFCTSVRLA